ncbi:MAG: DUF362 domain-containing protein [Synergistaceae bacterium]
MSNAKVYFTTFRTTPEINILQKLNRLIIKAGIKEINLEKQYVAIKLHLGEPGNIAYLRPNFSKVVADLVKELGGKPFLTDSNTLYVGRRKDGLEHLEAAYENGYNPFCTGCHVIIADGIKGNDEISIPVEGGEYIKEAKIGRAIMDADVIISLTHFKGHECSGFGGAIKNIGMGSGSRAGKMEMHSSGKPEVQQENCIGCTKCTKVCAQEAIKIKEKKAKIDIEKCVGCGRCLAICPVDAIEPLWGQSNDIMCKKMAEYTKAVLQGKEHFHISIIMDVSPYCDCHCENDAAIIPNIGILASKDPVALDQACADLVIKAPVISQTYLDEQIRKGIKEKDHFHTMHPDTHWQTTLEHSEKLGIGTRKYDLIEI